MFDQYQITYYYKDRPKVIQKKFLIPHSFYLANKDGKNRKNLPEFFFTDESPLYNSIKTGILDCFGGEKAEVKIEKITI